MIVSSQAGHPAHDTKAEAVAVGPGEAEIAGLLFTCVGVPTYRNKGGGRPGEPASVVVPTPGLTLPAE